VKKQILFVDDEPDVLNALRRMLHSRRKAWDITCVNHPEEAWSLLQERPFDVVISDIKMPGMGGLDLLERITQTEQTKNIPVVMLTGSSSRGLKRQALEIGATDLLNKPIELDDLVARLNGVFRLTAYQDELKTANALLEQRVEERTRDLFHARLDIIWRLGKAAEHRDEDTGNHVIRVGCISRVIAETLGLDQQRIETLFLAAPLHDIGKIGIPDAVLRKPGHLNSEEWEIMKQHCQIGARILREDSAVKNTFWEWRGVDAEGLESGQENAVLEMGALIALTHHEKWNGTGYPQGLSGEDIPLEACIVAIADVFDAMTSKRPYKKPYSEDYVLDVIRQEAGIHFAPDVYAAFVSALPEIISVRQHFADNILLSQLETETELIDTMCFVE